MRDNGRVAVESELGVVAARQTGRALAESLGFSATEQTLIATAISEVARNILQYAKRGEIVMTKVRDSEQKGIEVIARDNGPGIENIELAMRDGYSTGKGMGLGLSGARRLMDEFKLTSEVNQGTVILMRKWTRLGG